MSRREPRPVGPVDGDRARPGGNARSGGAAGTGHRARKRFGQHFLVDRAVLAAIVNAIAPTPRDRLLEIGPGLGALTEVLLESVAHLTAIEIDRDLAARLRKRYPPDRLTLIEADALRADWAALAAGGALRLVGNLPYNVATPLMTGLIPALGVVRDAHFMVQLEVAERLVAKAGASYGRLGVLMQAFFDMEIVITVPAQAFDPPPRVESAVVRMVPRARPAVAEPAGLERLLAVAFGQRRKMLRGTLLPWLAGQGVQASDLEPTARPEDVAAERYHALARELGGAQTPSETSSNIPPNPAEKP